MPALLELLPDARARGSIPAALFGIVLLYQQLLRIPSFAPMGRVRCRSPALLRQMGFNRRQVNDGSTRAQATRPDGGAGSTSSPHRSRPALGLPAIEAAFMALTRYGNIDRRLSRSPT